MKKGNPIFIVTFIGLGLLLLVYLIFSASGKRQYNWYQSYSPVGDEPYDLVYLSKLLDGFNGNELSRLPSSPHLALKELGDTGNIYCYFGHYAFYNEADEKEILSFAARGNTVFIASDYPNETLFDSSVTGISVGSGNFYKMYNDTQEVTMHFYQPALEKEGSCSFVYYMKDKKVATRWTCVDASFLGSDSDNIVPLGYMDQGYINLIQVNHGKGRILFCTTPLVFCNYYLQHPAQQAYVSRVLSHMGKGHIYWDDVSRSPYRPDADNDGRSGGNNPLSYVIEQHVLRNSFYLLLLLSFLYLVFTARRRERVVPVIEPVKNTSLEYLRSIGRLYYRNANHTAAADRKMKYFLSYIRQRYGLSTARIDETFYRRLSMKSGVAYDDIRELFRHYDMISKYEEVFSEQFWEFSQQLSRFYAACRK